MNLAYQHKAPLSEQTMIMASRFAQIEASLKHADKPHTFCQLLKNFLETIKSQDPNIVHYDIARSILERLDKEAVKNEHTVDMLARELLRACHALDEQLKIPLDFAKLIKRDQTTTEILYDPYPIVIELPKSVVALEEQFFTKDGLSLWDNALIKLLSSFGITGKAQATAHTKKMHENSNHWDPFFWLMPDSEKIEEPFFHTEAFFCLATALWKDIIEEKINVTQKNIIPIGNSKTGMIEIKQQLHLMNGFELISTVHFPAKYSL